jgi:hypothetical protein
MYIHYIYTHELVTAHAVWPLLILLLLPAAMAVFSDVDGNCCC